MDTALVCPVSPQGDRPTAIPTFIYFGRAPFPVSYTNVFSRCVLHLRNSSVLPDLPQLEMISRSSPTTVTFRSDPGSVSSLFMSERDSFPHLGAETNILLLILFNHI